VPFFLRIDAHDDSPTGEPWTDPAPVREELFGVERLEQHARSLAAAKALT